MRPVSRFGLYSANEIVELLLKNSAVPMVSSRSKLLGNLPVCIFVSNLICGSG